MLLLVREESPFCLVRSPIVLWQSIASRLTTYILSQKRDEQDKSKMASVRKVLLLMLSAAMAAPIAPSPVDEEKARIHDMTEAEKAAIVGHSVFPSLLRQ